MLTAISGNRVRAADTGVNGGKDAACHVVEPVVVEALSVRSANGERQIAFDPPVTLSCTMASTVATWLDTSVQPLVRGHFDRDLAGLRVGGGHECRRRNRAVAGPLSEHATGKALDIFAFTLTGEKTGQTVVVEKPDGPAQSNFLQAIRQSACGAFNTSLGPGSDSAHANHLHVDTQERRSPSSHFCQ
ncbi:extensin family protein [Bosea lathyri]|uniref:Extensin-like protein C-terminus n=1 Tax=Bosea lathyri TaxID=1036778 RepID=A0A1H6A8T3_9HYPH|nr:extensin family protein [Bosea lathyri]SEG44851.1 Extensin-like protein C-terminus [Bosea lathyri]